MNLLLLLPDDLTHSNQAKITGRRHQHIVQVIKAKLGDALNAGVLNGAMGTATIIAQDTNTTVVSLALNQPPPQPLPLTLILALPRPKVLRRVLQAITTLGVKQIHLIGSWRVEKSYWQSPFLESEKIQQQLLLGLEQTMDTQIPDVHLHPYFKPFAEDQLKAIAGETSCIVAHPTAKAIAPTAHEGALTLAIGPEGGFIPYEIQKFEAAGFQAATLGARILSVEVAVSSLISRLTANPKTH